MRVSVQDYYNLELHKNSENIYNSPKDRYTQITENKPTTQKYNIKKKRK